MGNTIIETSQFIKIPMITFSNLSPTADQGGVGSRRSVWQTRGTVNPATNHIYAYAVYRDPFNVQKNAQKEARNPDTIHFCAESDHVVPVTPYVIANRMYDHTAPIAVPTALLIARIVVLPMFGCHMTTTVNITSVPLPWKTLSETAGMTDNVSAIATEIAYCSA
jgi:hypothetical protein